MFQIKNSEQPHKDIIVFFNLLENRNVHWHSIDAQNQKNIAKGMLELDLYFDANESNEYKIIEAIQNDAFFNSLNNSNYSFIRLSKEFQEKDIINGFPQIPKEFREIIKENNIQDFQTGESYGLIGKDAFCITTGIQEFKFKSKREIETLIDCPGRDLANLLPVAVFLKERNGLEEELFSGFLTASGEPLPVQINFKGFEKGQYFLKFSIGKNSRFFPIKLE
ncbi:MAG: hypothetical protein H0X62_00200 [Bacteroidetes bacterium]|nr:hypothetical protein [Bacteroidota bacterium]